MIELFRAEREIIVELSCFISCQYSEKAEQLPKLNFIVIGNYGSQCMICNKMSSNAKHFHTIILYNFTSCFSI